MKVELINTGTELLIGDVINTNAAWLGQCLVEMGVTVERSTCVPDGLAIEEALSEAVRRSRVVIVTGGLGPTSDDVSREGAAAVFKLPLEINPSALRTLEQFFALRGRDVNEHNRRQAMAPLGAVLLPNSNGTAPGLHLPAFLAHAQGFECDVFLLPGPPRELRPMMRDQVVPILRQLLPAGEERACRYYKFTGLGESDISMALQTELDAVPGLETGYCLGKGDVDVRFFGTTEAVGKAGEICRSKLSEFLISDDRRVLEEVVVHLLLQKGQWVATAESCTGGRIASRLTDVSGASSVFGHGFITYANEAKSQLLGVPMELIQDKGAVSEETARAMAEGCLRASGADHAIAVTGIAGPGGGSEEKPVGTVYIGLASKGADTEIRKRWYSGDRERFKMLASQAALDLLRRRLCGYGLPNS